MSLDRSSPLTLGDMAQYAAAFAVGLVLMGYPAITYWQYAYMQANPAVGSISTDTTGVVVYLVMFLAGASMAFNATMLGLARVIDGASAADD